MARTTITGPQVHDNTIANVDIASNAAIDGTKITPNFGAQDLIVDTNVLVVDESTNRVGIGTASPDSALHVAGQIKITGGSPGTGKVLTSDTTGLSTWENPTVSFITILTNDPGSPSAGQIWFNNTDKQYKGYNGSAIVILG